MNYFPQPFLRENLPGLKEPETRKIVGEPTDEELILLKEHLLFQWMKQAYETN